MDGAGAASGRRFPAHGEAGLLLIAVCWPLNWALPGMRSHIVFFPLWLGYALAVDAWALQRGGRSLLAASRREFAMLFVLSAPAWWLFELINERTGNWEYLGGGGMSGPEYFGWATLSFSTVMPAVFGTAALADTFGFVDRFGRGPRVPAGSRALGAYAVAGAVMLALLLAWPRYFYPFTWLSIFFIVDPINARLGRRSILRRLGEGDWRGVATLWAAALVCGFFWEMWNWQAYPKWVYHVPSFGFWQVFEMPVLGYLGYLPFALELYALRAVRSWKFEV